MTYGWVTAGRPNHATSIRRSPRVPKPSPCSLDDDAGMRDKRTADRGLWLEREDERAVGVNGLAQYFDPGPFANSRECAHSVVEHALHQIHGEMIGEEPKTRQRSHFTCNGQLAGGRWTEDENDLQVPLLECAA